MKLLSLLALLAIVAAAQEGPAYGMQLEGFAYPWPVALYRFRSQGQALEMAYMDVKPSRPNGRTAVLLHGKNFCAATWEATITALVDAGYRVIAPDQIGFCKSSKPEKYQFSFQQLAGNTHALLESLGVRRATVIGHSTGGMLGIRYALMYPSEVEQLVIGRPDRARGLEGARRPLAEHGCLVSARTADHGGTHPLLRARHVLCGDVGASVRTLGADAGRHVSRSRTRAGCLGFGAAIRHDLYAARGL